MGGKADKKDEGKSKTDWNAFFRDAHLQSWPFPSCAISNKPMKDGNDKWSSSLFATNEKEILIAAKQNNFELIVKSAAMMCFALKKELRLVNFDGEASSCKAAEDSSNLSQGSKQPSLGDLLHDPVTRDIVGIWNGKAWAGPEETFVE